MSRKCCLCGTWEYKLPNETNITFHSIPREAELRKRWFDAVGLKESGDYREMSLCSVHFSIKDFQIQSSGRIVLKSGAMPVSINFNSSPRQNTTCNASNYYSVNTSQPSTSAETYQIVKLRTDVAESPSVSNHCLTYDDDDDEVVQEVQNSDPELSDASYSTSTASETERHGARPRPKRFCRKAYIGDIRDEDFAHPERARQAFLIAKAKIDLQKKTIKGLQQTVLRLNARIDKLIAKIALFGKPERKSKSRGFRIVRRRRLQRIGNHRYLRTQT